MESCFKAVGGSLKDILVFVANHLLAICLLVAVVSWAALLLPPQAIVFLHIGSFLSGTIHWFGLAALITTVIFVCLLMYNGGSALVIHRKQKILLSELTLEERKILRIFIDQKSPAAAISLYDGIPFALVGKGILQKADSLPNHLGEQDFIIAPWVYKELDKHPDILKK